MNIKKETINANIRFSEEQDNLALIEIFKKYPTSSSLSYVVDRSPNYFSFTNLQGNSWKILVSEVKNEIVGSLTIIFDKVILEKQIQEISYTCDLRLDTSVRGLGLADELMKKSVTTCQEVFNKEIPIFTCVLKDNKAGLKKNQNLDTLGITKMEEIAEINTYFFLPFFSGKKTSNYVIRTAKENDLNVMFELWHKVSAKKNLAKYFTFEEFKNWIINTEGLGLSAYLVAEKDNKIVSFLGLWNQNKLRRVLITSEKKAMKVVRGLWNTAKIFKKLPDFPQPNKNLNFYNVINLCIDKEYDDAFIELIQKAFLITRENNAMFLALALDKKDPLNSYASKFKADRGSLLLLSNYKFSKPIGNTPFHMEIGLG